MTSPPVAARDGLASRAVSASLTGAARAVLECADPSQKAALSREAGERWFAGTLSLGRRIALPMPDRPGRPARPLLASTRDLPKRGYDRITGRIALIHALAHIELNAIDMAWDIIGRFSQHPLPRAFFDDWVGVATQEAVHFTMLVARLEQMGAHYGDLPAHDGLWQAAAATSGDLLARLAIVPLVLEARGLDVTPQMIERLRAAGDEASAAILEIIYHDEKDHVAKGVRWFRHVCAERGLPLERTFHKTVRMFFKGLVKPPFNEAARTASGLTPAFYLPLSKSRPKGGNDVD